MLPCHLTEQLAELATTAMTRPVLNPRERMALGRDDMPEQPATDPGAATSSEVNLGFTHVLAVAEAERCLMCKNPPCVDGCPVRVNIPRFIDLVAEGDMQGAAESLLDDNALPCITGRVCPQETQCEGMCLRGKKGAAGGHRLTSSATWPTGRWQHPEAIKHVEPASTGQRVAIVGSGPAGLTAAGELAKAGHEVTIFEALHTPAAC